MLAGSAESCAYVRDKIFLLAVFISEDGIVFVLEVPVAEKGHHHPQAVELARAHKWIVLPVPVGIFFFAASMALQAGSINMVWRNHVALPAVQVGGKLLHFQIGDVIVLIGEIADGPQKPGRHHFRLRLNSQLGLPLGPIRIFHIELGILSVPVFF